MRARSGFTMIECLVCLALVSAVLSIGPISCLESRKTNRRVVCQSNLHQLCIASMNYAADFKDAIASFTLRKGQKQPDADAAFNEAKDDVEAAANQAVWIIRTRADREDIRPISDWLPNPSYTHLVLIDYLQQRIPEAAVICPEDSPRAALLPKQKRGAAPAAAVIPPAPDNAAKRWPYSSSYQFVPATYSRDRAAQKEGPTIAQGPTDDEYIVPRNAPFGPRVRRVSEVSFPSAKVLLMDSHDRHTGNAPVVYADAKAAQPLAVFDGSVHRVETAKANKGFRPNDPGSREPTVYTYAPTGAAKDWSPAPTNPGGDRNLIGFYRWTREGLRGVDFTVAETVGAGAAAAANEELLRKVAR